MMKKYLLAAVLFFAGTVAWGEGRMYTRKAKLQDFTAKTLRVVLTGQEVFDTMLKEEISSRWMVSPYEFCTVQEYHADKLSNMYYFLRFAFDDHYTYMVLSKSGDPENEDQLKQGFDVVMLPVAPAHSTLGSDMEYLPAYIDIIQRYAIRARESDNVAYRGLKGICSKPFGPIYTDRDEAMRAFADAEPYANIKVIIPSSVSGKKRCEMIISTDTHELRRFKK